MHYRIFRISFSIYWFLLLSLLSQQSFAQDESNYSLLWKIEGKDTSSPSYLFGTMHVEDARAFNFSDAVIPAIESVKYFALEINPDSIMVAFTNKKYDINANNFYKKLLKPRDYKRLLKRFEAINDYSLKDSEIMSPDVVLSLLIPQEEKEDDKSTSVDMYLLGHARTMNKDIVGLEAIDDQVSYFDNLSDENKIKQVLDNLNVEIDSLKRSKELMTTIYQTGDLSKIEAFINKYDHENTNMISRNKVMSNSIIKFMKKGSIFAGVGAAHLVGKESVIELLQNEGYKVTAVEAKFTGVADSYKIDPSKGFWYNYINDDLGYYLEIPKAPNIEEGNDNFTVKGYGDMTTNTTYLFMGLSLSYNLEDSQIDVLMEKMISNMMEKREAEIISKDKLPDTDKVAYDVTSELPDKRIMKSRFVLKNNHFYYFSVETPKEQIEENYVNRFLNSIVVNGVEQKIKTVQWQEFKSEKGAFSIEIPTEPKDLSRESPNPLDPEGEPYFLNLYMAMDTKNKNNYLFRYNDQPIGYFIESPESAFEGTKTSLTQKATLLSEPKVIYLDGIEGREYEISINDKFHSIARVYFRGNRTYLLLKQKISTTEKATTDGPFFKSFTMQPYKASVLKDYSPSDKSFDIQLFENVTESIDSSDYENSQVVDSHDYATVNPATGGVYQYGYSNIRKYFRTPTYKAFLDLYKNSEVEYNDSIVRERIFTKDGDSIVEFSVKNRLHLKTKRQRICRIWLNNNRIQLAKAIVSDEEANSGIVERVFNSIRMNTAKTDFNIFESKAKYIIEDLKSKDSIIYDLALKSFDYYEYNKDELADLHQALDYDFSQEKNDIIKAKIIYELSLINDESSIKVLEEFYNKSDTSDNLKASVLSAIPEIESTGSLTVYNKLLFANPPIEKDSYSYDILQPFNDSLNYALENYDKLLKLMPYIQYRGDLIDISKNIFTSELEAKNVIQNNQNKILEFLKTDSDYFFKQSETENEDDGTYDSLMYTYLRYLNTIKSDSKICDTFTLKIIDGDYDKWMKLQAIIARIFNNYNTPKDIKNKYLEDKYFQYEIMEAYHKQNRFSEIEKIYLKPKAFAKLSFYNYAGEENGYPDRIDITKTITKNKQDFYVLKFSYNSEESDEDANYIGIVGPIKGLSQSTDFKMFDSLTYWDNFDDDWENKAETLITDLLEYID
ncbi:TraB/GumN family protein [uncultured Winogradskyella sp.]|uniref:TraB/GumN family protein n=1 Tax=uncultured Winogradskyella sp. TaxID=395353 RepID=UPI002629248C|nr:TraB/GumN family protein [uncultured Winogradskyella sp.]